MVDEPISVRVLASLPPLDQITFLRKESRAYVTGQGPFPVMYRGWLGTLFFAYAALFAVAGIATTVVAYEPMLVLGHPLSPSNDWLRLLGPLLFMSAVFDVGLGIFFRRMAGRGNRLVAEGGLLPGELLSARVRANKGGNYLQVECRFLSPEGKLVTAKKNVGRPDRSLMSPPAEGSRVLVLYDTDRIWQVL